MTIVVPGRASLGRLAGEPGETLTAALRRSLLDMILFGWFDDGKRLKPRELAAHFDVSPTPVREALMRLASEGYIEEIPRRGFRVKQPTAREVHDLWQVRLGLEITAAELAIARLARGELAAADFAPMATIQRRRDGLGAGMSPKQNIELNAAFHQHLVALGGNGLLRSMYAAIQIQVAAALVQRGVTAWRARLADDSREHHAILDALKAGDLARCTQALRAHVARSLAGALDDIGRQEDKGPPVRRSQGSVQAR
jgi:DNA-binding GntR family transcriptional regulator